MKNVFGNDVFICFLLCILVLVPNFFIINGRNLCNSSGYLFLILCFLSLFTIPYILYIKILPSQIKRYGIENIAERVFFKNSSHFPLKFIYEEDEYLNEEDLNIIILKNISRASINNMIFFLFPVVLFSSLIIFFIIKNCNSEEYISSFYFDVIGGAAFLLLIGFFWSSFIVYLRLYSDIEIFT